MNDISFQQILYFRAAMRSTSFSAAAKLAYTTQSTISKEMRALERVVGEPLFIRGKRGSFPTQRAVELDMELTGIYDTVDRLLTGSEALGKEELGIGFCQSIDFLSTIPHFFETLREFEEELNVRLVCRENSEVLSGVLDGSLDLGFILSDSNPVNPNIKLHTAVSAAPRVYFSRNCPLARADKPLSPEAFSRYPLITTKYLIEQNGYRMVNLLPFTPAWIKIVDSYDDVLLHLATGRYITLLRPYVNLANNVNVVGYELPASYSLKQGVSMIWRKDNKNSRLKALLNKLRLYDKQP